MQDLAAIFELMENLEPWTHNKVESAFDSSFFNQREELSTFYGYAMTTWKSTKKWPSKEQIHSVVYPNSTFSDSRIRLLQSDLLKLIEEILLCIKTKEQDPIISATTLLQFYRKAGIKRYYEILERRTGKLTSKTNLLNAERWFARYQYELERYQYHVESQRARDLEIGPMMDDLDRTFAAQKLRQACYALAHQKVFQEEYEINLLKEILNLVERRSWIEIPAIGAYYHAYLALSINKDHHFHALVSIIDAHSQAFPVDELRGIYILAINFCIYQYRNGKPGYSEELFSLYEKGLESKTLLSEGKISRFTYRNIIGAALLLDKVEWAQRFAKDYKERLNKRYREPIFLFNMGRISYYNKKYEEARGYLVNSDYEDFLLSLSAKTILMKIYYEIEEYRLLDSHLDAMMAYIKRKRLASGHFKNYKTIVDNARRLMKCNPYDKASKLNLKNRILNEPSFLEREWFLQQLS